MWYCITITKSGYWVSDNYVSCVSDFSVLPIFFVPHCQWPIHLVFDSGLAQRRETCLTGVLILAQLVSPAVVWKIIVLLQHTLSFKYFLTILSLYSYASSVLIFLAYVYECMYYSVLFLNISLLTFQKLEVTPEGTPCLTRTLTSCSRRQTLACCCDCLPS